MAAVALAAACDSSPQYGDINVNANISAADGLDLKAVGALVKDAKDAKDFEAKLNEPGGINNLDLNADGKVDFIKVTEYGNEKAKGFSLTVEPEKGETQEIATIEVEKPQEDKKVDVYVRGNEHVYGAHHHYHHTYPVGTMLLMAYLFRPHPFYVSPFGFGYYPPYYGFGYPAVSRTTYVSRTRTITRGANATQVSNRSSSIQSPNRGKNASRGIRASLRNPTKSQRSFQARAAKPTNTRGFAQRVQSRGTSRRAAPSRPAPSRRRSTGFSRRSSPRRSFGSRGFRSRR